MKTKKQICFFTLIFIFIISLQNTTSQVLTWQKLYNGEMNFSDLGNDVCETIDSNYVVVGSTKNPSFSIYVIKLNKFGDTIWSKSLGNYGSSANAVVATKDGGIVLTGDADSAFTIKLNSSGDLIWWKRYGSLRNVQLYDLITTYEGGFLACGRILSGGSYIIKVNSDGVLEWDQTIKHQYTFLFSAAKSHDKGYVLTGATYKNLYDSIRTVVVKINNYGDIEWQKSFLIQQSSSGKCVNKIVDGYLISGSSYINPGQVNSKASIYYIKIDLHGKLITSKIFATKSSETLGSVIVTDNNNYLFSGMQDTASFINAKLMIADSSGKIIKEKIYSSVKYLLLESSHQTFDSGYIFVGTWGKLGINDRDDIYVLKTDKALNAPPIVNIFNQSSSIPNNHLLYLAYPNPFNSQTNIKFEVKQKAIIKLKVIDISGKEVTILIDEEKKVGIYTINWNASKLPSGIYVCQVMINKIYSSSMKLILIK